MALKLSDLKKPNLSETYCELSKLVRGKNETNRNEFENIINLKGLDIYEQSIRMFIVNSLKLKDCVVSALLSDDVHQIKGALNCSWFFKNSATPDFYENEVFPVVSVSTRFKVINKLSRYIDNPDYAEQLFKFILSNYGSEHAEMLLPKCSHEFCHLYVTDRKPLFQHKTSIRVLINIMKRYPDVVVLVLERIYDSEYDFREHAAKCSAVVLCLAKHHQDKFLSLLKNNYLQLTFLGFGYRLTRTLTPLLKAELLPSGKKQIFAMIKKKKTFKLLTPEEQVDFLVSLVRSANLELTESNWSETLSDIIFLLRPKSKVEKVQLFETVFDKVYKKSLWDHPRLWSTDFLEVLPLEYREKCVAALSAEVPLPIEKPLSKSTDEIIDDKQTISEQYLYLLRCDKSFPRLKDIASKSPTVGQRGALLENMAKSCFVNMDLQSLEGLCAFAAARYRNDDPTVLKGFVSKILGSFNYLKLSLPVWEKIEEIANAMLFTSGSMNDYDEVIGKYAKFREVNGLSTEQQMRNIVRQVALKVTYTKILLDHKVATKQLLLHMYGQVFKAYEEEFEADQIVEACEKSKWENAFGVVVSNICDYNSHAHRDKIAFSDLTKLIAVFDAFLDKTKADDESVPYWMAQAIREDAYLEDKYLSEILRQSFEPNNFSRFWTKYPDYTRENLEEIATNVYHCQEFFHHKKILTCMGFCEKLREIALEKIKSGESISWGQRLFSIFTTIEEFSELVNEFLPKKPVVEYDMNESDFHSHEQIVPKVIRNIKPDSKNFPLIAKFLQGDYLKLVFGSFCSAVYNSPVQVVQAFLKENLDKPVSVKKNIFRAVAAVTTLPETLRFISEMWTKEKHYSIRTVLMQMLTKCFVENPTDDSFSVLKQCLPECDENSIEGRPDHRLIPPQYLTQYIVALWQFSNNQTNAKYQADFRNKIIGCLDRKRIAVLSEKFCEELIENYLNHQSSKVKICSFAVSYLLSDAESISRKLDWLVKIIIERKQNRAGVASFAGALQRISLLKEYKEINFEDIFDFVLKKWPEMCEREDMHNSFLTLGYYRSYHSVVRNVDPGKDGVVFVSSELGKKLGNTFYAMKDKKYLISIVADTMSHFLDEVPSIKKMLVVKSMLRSFACTALAILVVQLIPGTTFTLVDVEGINDEEKLLSLDDNVNFSYIVRRLELIQDEPIRIYFQRKFGPNVLKHRPSTQF